jgi:hypothetical protein
MQKIFQSPSLKNYIYLPQENAPAHTIENSMQATMTVF